MSGRKLIDERNDRGARLQLWEHLINGHREMEMVIDGIFIMASYNHLSSELMIRKALQYIGETNIDILVGGLGMGFTIQEACSHTNVRSIDVVEIQPAIVEWNHKELRDYNGGCLEDSRVKVIVDDFYDYVTMTKEHYDIIAMDIDNGPMMLVKADNERVYNREFFTRVKAVMKAAGIFVIWSCNPEPELLNTARQVFAECFMEQVVEEHSGRSVPYYLYFARS
ncbi:MAG: hypothetical protein ACOX6I_04150 [Syntrophomonadaceae bacterium]|jgi:spermidine synthase